MKIAPYNYKHFRPGEYAFEEFKGPKIGEKFINFKATSPDGQEIEFSSLLDKITVLEAGSLTCPLFMGKIAKMHQLRDKYPNINFAILYVREAHPGEKIPCHTSFQDKVKYAQRLQKENKENRIILIDDLHGTAHREYGSYPNMVYVFDTNGTVIYRTAWNNPKMLDAVLQAIEEGKPIPKDKPKYFGTPVNFFPTLWHSGFRAFLDFFIAIPWYIYSHIKVVTKAKRNKK